ncbi:MAG TPA: hypothetical protein VJ805_08515 [Nitrospiraceae bacterium]|nr:hypothetical protein [Nitrospiraceae bacterium]
MACTRCGGFVVIDRSTAYLQQNATGWSMRCVNCGNCEDPVIHANRRHRMVLRRSARAVDTPSGGVLTLW